MAELYQTTAQNITRNLEGIYDEGESPQAATCKKSLQVRTKGNRQVLPSLKHDKRAERGRESFVLTGGVGTPFGETAWLHGGRHGGCAWIEHFVPGGGPRKEPTRNPRLEAILRCRGGSGLRGGCRCRSCVRQMQLLRSIQRWRLILGLDGLDG